MTYNIIILGSQCSGKTTAREYIQAHTNYSVTEMDEELKKLHVDPFDHEYKNKIALPIIEKKVLQSENIIYFASYMDFHNIHLAKNRGFTIIRLHAGQNLIHKRNHDRMKEGYDDAKENFEWYKNLSNKMFEEGFFDITISTARPIESVVKKILQFIR